MPVAVFSPSPVELLTAALGALAAEDPRDLDPDAARERARVMAAAAGRMQCSWLDSLADVDERELFAEDGAGSTRGWLRQQPCGDAGQLSLARRLQVRRVVHGALSSGSIGTRAATNVCQALASVDDLESDGPLPESQVIGVISGAIPDALSAWTGFDRAALGSPVDPADLPPVRPGLSDDLRNEREGRRELLAVTLLEAAQAEGQQTSERLEPLLTLMARALSPHALATALAAILDALQPERLDDEDEAFEPFYELTKRSGRGWDCRGLFDDEEGEYLHQDLVRRMQRLARRDDPDLGDDLEPVEDDAVLDAFLDRLAGTYGGDLDDLQGDPQMDPEDVPAETGPRPDATPGDVADDPQTPDDRQDDVVPHRTGRDAGPAAEPSTPVAPPAPPRLFDDDPHWGRVGPGLPYLPPDGSRDRPVEGGAETTGKGNARYLALVSALHDAYGADLGSGSPPPARVTIVASAEFAAGVPGAHPALVKVGRQLRHLSAAALRRRTCDGLVAAVIVDAAGNPVGASGTHRHATDRERRALQAQWGLSCATNGCCDTQTIPHHVEMFSRGGVTRLADLVPLCRHHHRAVHEGKRTLRLRDGRYLDEDGWVGALLAA